MITLTSYRHPAEINAVAILKKLVIFFFIYPFLTPNPSKCSYNIGGTNTAGEAAEIMNPNARAKGTGMLKIPIASKQIEIASITGENITSNNTNTPYLIFNISIKFKLLSLSSLYTCQRPIAILQDKAFCNISPIANRSLS